VKRRRYEETFEDGRRVWKKSKDQPKKALEIAMG
jgi:hypothetical protein